MKVSDSVWKHEDEVARRAREMSIAHEATMRHKAELAAAMPRPDLLEVGALLDMTVPEPLFGRLFYRDTLVQLAGQEGSYKSMVLMGVACSVALGRDWGPHAVPSAENVLLVVGEGTSGYGKRLVAWCRANGVDPHELDGKLAVTSAPVQLGVEDQVDWLVEEVVKRQARLVVFDTRARCTVGLDENSATDQGVAIEAAERVRRAVGATVVVVHHLGKSGGQRGSTAWPGAVWTLAELERSGLRKDANRDPMGCTIHVTKQKDGEKPGPVSFDMHEVVIPAGVLAGDHEQMGLTAAPCTEPHPSRDPDPNANANAARAEEQREAVEQAVHEHGWGVGRVRAYLKSIQDEREWPSLPSTTRLEDWVREAKKRGADA